MRICGIDPGTRVLGFGVVDVTNARTARIASGVVRAPAAMPLYERLRVLRDGLRDVLETTRPDAVAVEKAFFGRNPQSLIAMGEGRGIALLCAADAGVPLFEYAPAEVKKAVTGKGGSTKEQVASMVNVLLALRDAQEALDASDALALALCHAQRAANASLQAAAGPDAGAGAPRAAALAALMRGARSRRGRGR